MITVDSNVILYLHDGRDPSKKTVAVEVIRKLGEVRTRVALQVVGETQNVLRRKFKLPSSEAAALAGRVLYGFDMIVPSPQDAEVALDWLASGRLSYWDALLISTVSRAGCTALLTEDLQDGATLLGVEIVNPFGADGLSPRAAALLAAA